jgi:hypothetical protein
LVESGGDRPERGDRRREYVARPDRGERSERAGEDDVPLRASHARAFKGSPRQATPVPVESSSPSRSSDIVTSFGSKSASGTRSLPSTKTPLEALSATVSAIVMSQSRTRLSTTSIAATAWATAARTSASGESPSRSAPRTKATSTSARGCSRRAKGIVSSSR